MSAAAHQLVDEPQDDPAEEAAMSAADFRIIEGAHEICGHPAARESQRDDGQHCPSLAVDQVLDEQRDAHWCESPALTRIASKILSAQIRAAALVAEMKARGVSKTCLVESKSKKFLDLSALGDDETDEVVTDWKRVAQDAWHSEGWTKAAEDYHTKRGKQRGVRQ